MATHKSALKRARQNLKRRARNASLRSAFRTAIKQFRTLLAAKDLEAAQTRLPRLHKTIDRAVTQGLIHKNQAARKKSRLTLALNRAQAA